MKVYLDADAFIAMYNRQDALHKQAARLVAKLEGQDVYLHTSWEVIDEVLTKISYAFSKKDALKFLDYLEDLRIEVVFPTETLAKRALEVFTSIESKRVSLTDCFNITVMREFELDYIFSFDKIYEKQELITLDTALR